MEAAFGEIRRMIGEGKSQTEVDNKIDWLKGELNAALPVLTGGHKLTAEQQHTTYENSDIAVYWQQSFKIIDDLLAQAIHRLTMLIRKLIPTGPLFPARSIDAAGLDEEGRRQFRADKIGLVFQQFHLIPYLTALENIMLAQHYHSVVDKAAARQVLEQVGMTPRMGHLPSQLSGGEPQRVCIARALVNQPPIIIADEPTGNLDEENEQRVLDLLNNIHRQGRTIVMVTHNPDLGCVADRIIRLQHGKYLNEESRHPMV